MLYFYFGKVWMMGEVTTLQKNIIIFVDIYTCLRLVRIQSAKIFPIKIIILNKNREEEEYYTPIQSFFKQKRFIIIINKIQELYR